MYIRTSLIYLCTKPLKWTDTSKLFIKIFVHSSIHNGFFAFLLTFSVINQANCLLWDCRLIVELFLLLQIKCLNGFLFEQMYFTLLLRCRFFINCRCGLSTISAFGGDLFWWLNVFDLPVDLSIDFFLSGSYILARVKSRPNILSASCAPSHTSMHFFFLLFVAEPTKSWSSLFKQTAPHSFQSYEFHLPFNFLGHLLPLLLLFSLSDHRFHDHPKTPITFCPDFVPGVSLFKVLQSIFSPSSSTSAKLFSSFDTFWLPKVSLQ